MRTSLMLALLVSATAAIGQETHDGSRVDATIDRGLAFLAKDAVAWKNEHHCVSCHHASLIVWAMREARQRGYSVDEPLLVELTKWVAESGNGTTGVPRPEGIPKALNAKAVHFALALNSGPTPDDASRAGLNLLLRTIEKDQLEDGSWAAWPETRPPIFGDSNDSMTALATLALLPAAAAGDETAKAARDKALRWLIDTKTDGDPQSIAIRLVVSQRMNRPAEECRALANRIQERQNADGGWSQAAEMPSDAWATGQSLCALAHAGLTSNDATVARGQAFLIKSQRDDGSWPMTSRGVRPGGEGSKSLIPITGAGSAWDVIGLARSR